jgi:glycosyltransferase involved in cell wall biosynthesis
MSREHPTVTIGLPVFNGERFLAEALDAIVTQSFEDFELLISDNASTDSTPEICRDFAARDRRIRVDRLPQNLGASINYNRLVDMARGRFFKWATHDDLLAPSFLEKCVEHLDADPRMVLCSCEIDIIDSDGSRLGKCDDPLPDLASPQPHRRFANLILVDHRCIDVFGLMRIEALRSTPRIAPYIASDRVLLAELGLLGRIDRIDETLFFSRSHTGQSIALVDMKKRAAWFDPANRGPVFPNWRLFAEYFRVVHRVPLEPSERARCHLHLLHWLGANWNWARMARDVIVAVAGGPGPLRRRNAARPGAQR